MNFKREGYSSNSRSQFKDPWDKDMKKKRKEKYRGEIKELVEKAKQIYCWRKRIYKKRKKIENYCRLLSYKKNKKPRKKEKRKRGEK